ncbi:hypothetical protein FRC03_001480 [Tulasnella sp. 419]|nr:hypothetical protein FRC03_001480 [Tulasnella sp. 419]
MHRQPGVPAVKADGWRRYVASKGEGQRDASNYPREPCVKYVERIRSALEKEVDDMIRKGVIHGDLHTGNVLLDEQWDNRDAQNPELVSVAVHVIDWGFWYEIPAITELLKKQGNWDYRSERPLKDYVVRRWTGDYICGPLQVL